MDLLLGTLKMLFRFLLRWRSIPQGIFNLWSYIASLGYISTSIFFIVLSAGGYPLATYVADAHELTDLQAGYIWAGLTVVVACVYFIPFALASEVKERVLGVARETSLVLGPEPATLWW